MAGGRAGRWFLLPGLVFLFAIDLIPLAYSAWISLYNWWLIRTGNLADCVLAHAVTNGLLAVYVVMTGRWEYLL